MRASKLLILLFVPSLALASGYSLPNVDTRDLGLCASGVAAQRDSGAAYTLPAALARLRGPSVRVGGGAINIFNAWDDPAFTATPNSSNATSVDMNLQYTPIGFGSVSYGGQVEALGTRGWGVGLAIQPYGGAIVKWPSDWPGEYRIIKVDRKVYVGTLTAGVEVLPMLRVGGGLVYYYTTQVLTQDAYIAGFVPGAPNATAKLDTSGGALSYDVSLEADPLPGVPITVAVDYKHKATQDTDGTLKWSGVPAPLAANPATGGIFRNQDVSEELTIPNTLNIGAAYRVTKPLLVTFTYTFDRWVVYDQDLFVGSPQADLGGFTPSLAVPRHYRDGFTLRAGAEYDLTPAFQVRAGLQRDQSGVRKEHYSPTLPDASSWGGSLGGTYRFARGLSVDAGVFYANMDKVKATSASTTEVPRNPATGSFRGSYDVAALVYNVSIGWQPGAM